MRGRRPKPTVLKVLEGNPGKRALPKDEPIPPDGEVVKPPMPRRAGEVWDKYAPLIEEMGLLTPVDVPAFGQLCRLIAESQGKKPMPAPRIARMESLFGRFGMDPSSRARLGGMGKPKKPANPFADLKTG